MMYISIVYFSLAQTLPIQTVTIQTNHLKTNNLQLTSVPFWTSLRDHREYFFNYLPCSRNQF